MTVANWASLLVAIAAIVTSFAGAIRWMVKHYLYELKPNGGSSLNDAVKRLEQRMDTLYELLLKKEQQ